MTRHDRIYLIREPVSHPTLSQGFSKLRQCVVCRQRRSLTQFIGDGVVCSSCRPVSKE